MTTSAPPQTHERAGIPGQREASGTHHGPDRLSPEDRQRLLLKIDGEDPANLLARVWTQSPVEDKHAYVQLLGGCIHYDVESGGITDRISNIERHVSDRALDRLPALTTIDHEKSILLIGQHRIKYDYKDWAYKGTEVILGPIAEKLKAHGANEINPKALADGTSRLMSNGDITYLESLFDKSATTLKNTPATPANHPETRAGTATEAAADAPPADATAGPRAIGSNITPRVDGILSIAKDRFNAVGAVYAGGFGLSTGAEQLSTGAEHKPSSEATKARVDLLPNAEIEALLDRTPRGECPRKVIPQKWRERSIEWRPILDESEPLAAMYQWNLLSVARDEDWHEEGDCTGIVMPHEGIFACFGMVPQVGYNRGINSAMLIEIYRRKVDETFECSDYNGEEGKARVIKSHSIPQGIIEGVKYDMLDPEKNFDWKYLITGKDAADKNWNSVRRAERKKIIDGHDPIIEPPQVAKEIQDYLNSLPQQYFGHGSHGILREDKLCEAAEVAKGLRQERRRDQEMRTLIEMKAYPQPLYLPCDRFPRLKADRFNQCMNLPSKILRAMYHERDRELDLSKAHLASYVPVAKREGIEVPTLERYLEANLAGDTDLLEKGDLWHDLASCLDLEGDPKMKRKVVKKAYSLVYGQDVRNLWFNLYREWGKLSGEWLDSVAPFKGLREHPLMDELLRTRDKLEAVIDKREGLEDANGRFIPLSAWDETKDRNNRWRGVMAYVNASYEQEIMYPIFREANKEVESDSYTRFKVWLYQADGVTIRIHRNVRNRPKVVSRLQAAVKERANQLGVPTRLEVDFPT